MTTSVQAGPAAIKTERLATLSKHVRWLFRQDQSLGSSQERDKHCCLKERVAIGSYF